MTKQIQLLGYVTITGEIEALSGLHIGGTADSIDKGGIDHPVIKNPVTNEPYIPGSSLRGRMRCLLEKINGQPLSEMATGIWMEIYPKKNPSTNNDQPDDSYAKAKASKVCRMFGNAQSAPGLPSILIVRDAHYTPMTKIKYMDGVLPYTEAKIEIAVDRITAQAVPRTIERVPSGARFDFTIIYRVQTDDQGQFDPVAGNEALRQDLNNILLALKEIEKHEGLGGNTSRGHGQVKFHPRALTVKNYKENDQNWVEEERPDEAKLHEAKTQTDIDNLKDSSFEKFLEKIESINFSAPNA